MMKKGEIKMKTVELVTNECGTIIINEKTAKIIKNNDEVIVEFDIAVAMRTVMDLGEWRGHAPVNTYLFSDKDLSKENGIINFIKFRSTGDDSIFIDICINGHTEHFIENVTYSSITKDLEKDLNLLTNEYRRYDTRKNHNA